MVCNLRFTLNNIFWSFFINYLQFLNSTLQYGDSITYCFLLSSGHYISNILSNDSIVKCVMQDFLLNTYFRKWNFWCKTMHTGVAELNSGDWGIRGKFSW
jgi:hypothetical protein